MDWSIGDIIAIYAAIVSTGALFLEIRRWFESGPRLRLRLMINARLIGGSPSDDEDDLVVVSVDNRGDAPTTITNLAVQRFPNIWARFRFRPTESYIVPNPQVRGAPSNVPQVLQPGGRWTGIMRSRSDLFDIEGGGYFVAVYANHKQRPFLKRVRERSKLTQNPNAPVNIKNPTRSG
jgi:hypothetical protein